MEISNTIEEKVRQETRPVHLELLNESHMHAGPATDSHFKLTLVSEVFASLNKVKRHQLIYRLLASELAGPVHALALHLYTPQEWEITMKAPDSPSCKGGE